MQLARLPLILVFAAMVQGCGNLQPDYIVVGLNPNRLSQKDAQNLLVQSYLQRQISQPIDRPITAIKIVLPPYPRKLINANIERTVQVRFVVDETGKVANPTVVGSAVGDLADLSLESVLQWQFEPIQRNGKPLKLALSYEFIFRIE